MVVRKDEEITEEEKPQQQIQVITDNQLVQIKLDEISAKLDVLLNQEK